MGVATGAIIAEKLAKDKYEKMMHEETEWLKAYYEKYPPINKTEKKVEDEEEWTELTDEEYEQHIQHNYSEDEYEEDHKTFINISKTYKTSYTDPADKEYPSEEIDEEEEMYNRAEEIYNSGSGIYIISAEEFNTEMLHYDKLTITYYDEDDTLADEQEEIITDIDDVVGDDALTKFGYMSGDADIVFVRNEGLAVDYEVIRVFKSYSETVLGIIEEPRHTRRRLNGEN